MFFQKKEKTLCDVCGKPQDPDQIWAFPYQLKLKKQVIDPEPYVMICPACLNHLRRDAFLYELNESIVGGGPVEAIGFQIQSEEFIEEEPEEGLNKLGGKNDGCKRKSIWKFRS